MFGISKELNAQFECASRTCSPGLAFGTCGDLGECVKDEENNTTRCACDQLSSGWFCEYPVNAHYVKAQTEVMLPILENSTTFEEFNEFFSNTTMKNYFYERYFQHQVQQFFANSSDGGPGLDSSRYYPTLDDTDNFRRLTRHVVESRAAASPLNVRFRL